MFFSFLLLFFLGIFFSFSSTSSLAGERLNKDFYFFFSKHLFYASFAIILMLFISFIDTKILTISQTEVTVSSNQQLVVLKLGQGTQF